MPHQKFVSAAITLLSYLLIFPSATNAAAVAIGYLSFYSDADGANTEFSLSNITDVTFDNSDLDVRYSTGGVGNGNLDPIILPPGSTRTLAPGGTYYRWGYATGTLDLLDFAIGVTHYRASSGLFQQFLYSSSQGYLGPGQNERAAVVVEAEIVTPEPQNAENAIIGLVVAFGFTIGMGSRIGNARRAG